MLKIFEPNKIFLITSKAPKYVMVLFIIVFSIGLLEALIFSPEDYKQSDSVRIMYVHVPAAWISLGTFSSITFLSLSGLDFITSISGAATSISNVGPGLGSIIGPSGNFSSLPEISKWILSLGMILGRLELFAILVLFLPSFWRN